MSIESPNEKCALCGAYLFKEDDVVYCPVCGAPHHRECYNSIGHCALEDKHGTAEQYKKPAEPKEDVKEEFHSANTVKCQMCGNEYDSSRQSCPSCNTPNVANNRFMFGFDFLGGVPAGTDLGEGVTADEAKRYVRTNTQRYIPKFAQYKIGKKSSWNWASFLFPCAWFLSRKMYRLGIVIGILQIAFEVLLFPFNNALFNFMPDNVSGYQEMFSIIQQNTSVIGIPAIATALVAASLMLVLRIICGIYGDGLYRNHCISTIKKLKSESEDFEFDLSKKGGFSVMLFAVGLLAVEYLPTVFEIFAGL